MGLELDWLEREERYRRRVLRMLVTALVLVGLVVAVAAVLRTRAVNTAKIEATKRAEEQREAAKKAVRDAFVADSSATANRYAEFLRVHGATPIADLPLIAVPLPPGATIPALVARLWTEYARVADPQVTAAQEGEWFRQHYIQVMNDGPLRGRAVLLPAMKQTDTKLTILKASFSDITRGQIEIGMRDMPKDAMAESLATAATEAAAAAADAAPAPDLATPKPAPPAETKPAPAPKPAPVDSSPVPAPAAAPKDTTPDPVPPAAEPPPAPAPPDSTPKP